MQRNWVGRSEGAEVDFPIQLATGQPTETIRVYTTRPDTLFGATYMVLAPEHPLVDRITTDAQRPKVETYRQVAATKSDLDRTDLAKTKTGVFTGAYATNPVNGQSIPVWIADYVLMGYGTGAIMAVPGHDERDFEFARAFDLPIVRVVASSIEHADAPLDRAEAEPGVAVHSRNDEIVLDGLPRPRPRSRRSPSGWSNADWARRPSITSCATGCFHASGTGASRFRSCSMPTTAHIAIAGIGAAGSTCPSSRTSNRPASPSRP